MSGCLLLVNPLAGGETRPAAQPPAPARVRGERQDFRAARIRWDGVGKNLKYLLYAAYDHKPYDFHKENDGRAFSDTFAIWDAPRDGPRNFVFYVTSVDANGNESPPSKPVRVDLGPPPDVPR